MTAASRPSDVTDPSAQANGELASELAQQIADQLEPDWQATPCPRPKRDALRLIHAVAGGFRAATEPPPTPPTLFPWRHLEVREEIGRGAFGRVYRAWDPMLRRDVALKLVDTQDRRAVEPERVIAEARCLARVRHPNILAVHGAETSGDRVGIWSDLLRGRTLAALLGDSGSLPAAAVIDLALPLAQALALVHSRALVHGDIKPANIMIQDDARPVLMDFGAAREQGLPGAAALGSPRFMAPEQLEGAAPSPAGDLFAFGVLLYRCLAGEFPWPARSLEELEAAYGARRPPELDRIPRPFRRLVGALLSTDPDVRPSAGSSAEHLTHLRRAPQRRRRRAALGVTIASLALGLTVALVALRSEKQTRLEVQALRDLTVVALQEADPVRTSGPTSIRVVYDALAERMEEALADFPAALTDTRLIVAEGRDRLGDLDAALVEYQKVLDETPAGLTRFGRRRCVAMLGVASVGTRLNETERAEAAALTALDPAGECAEALSASQRLVARNKLISVYDAQGRWRDMLETQVDLLADRQKLHGVGSLETAVDHHNLGQVYARLGDSGLALEHGRRAEGILEANGDGNSLRLGYVKLSIASIYGDMGALDKAQNQLDEARELYAANLPAGHRSLWDIEAEQARLWRLGGALSNAEGIYRDHLALPKPEAFERRQRARRNLAYVLIERGEWTEAHGLLVERRRQAAGHPSALDAYFRAAEAMTAMRAGLDTEAAAVAALDLALADLERRSLQKIEPYRHLVRWRGTLADPRPQGSPPSG